MPNTLRVLNESKPHKKICWKEDFSKMSELKSLVTSTLKLENCFVGIFGVGENGMRFLKTDEDVREFLEEQKDVPTVTIDVYCTPISQDDTFLTKDYAPLYSPTQTYSGEPKLADVPEAPKKYPKTSVDARKKDWEGLKTLKSASFVDFSLGNYSPYHVVRKLEGHLIAEGFIRLNEASKWDLVPGGKYYIKRGHYSAIVGFIVPPKIDADQAYFKIVGTHCDSPCIRLCPKSKIVNGGYLQLDVQSYGGALFKTWFDRELSIGGRVTVRSKEDPSKLTVLIYSSKGPLAFIPNMCPHLQNTIDETPLNNEVHLRPIIGLGENPSAWGLAGDHFDFILNDIATSLKVPKESIVDTELCLADATPARVFGPSMEFLAASKMDNTASAWAALDAILNVSEKPESLPAQGIPVMVAFDHEEIGSQSIGGAFSEFLPDVLKRVVHSLSGDKGVSFELFKRASARSFFISADMGHATNPNYREYFKTNYQTALNKGVLVKTNDSHRYTSTSVSRSILKAIADEHSIPLQHYVGRNDKRSGSTIGPMLSSLLGMTTIDVGGALLAMHSIRELIGVEDLANYSELFRFAFLAKQAEVNDVFK
jgi:aspartyl aminopeptidase